MHKPKKSDNEKSNVYRIINSKNEKLEIGPYIRRTKIFDEFYGFYTKDGKERDVLIQIFPCIYNLQEVSINRIKDVLSKLKLCPYAQEFIGFYNDEDTEIVSLVYQYYPKSTLSLPIEPKSDLYTKYIPAFIYKGILCLQYLKTYDICHHDICLENIYFGNPVGSDGIINSDDVNNDKKKSVNQDPLNFEFRLLNWAFSTTTPITNTAAITNTKSVINTDDKVHAISVNPRYQYKSPKVCSLFKKDPFLRDIWDFGITIFSLFDKENIPHLLEQIDNEFISKDKIKWDELLKNYHQYRRHCLTIKKIFEKIFVDLNSSYILTDLIFSNLFTIDFFQSEEVAVDGYL